MQFIQHEVYEAEVGFSSFIDTINGQIGITDKQILNQEREQAAS
jgi:hypothetical protein